MNELAKLVESSKSPEKTIESIDYPEFNKFINKTPTYNPKKYFSNYFYHFNCLCHNKKNCHYNHCHCHHYMLHNLSSLNMRNPAYKYRPNLIRNKTMNNLLNYNYKKREVDPKKIYYINYNENNNIKKYNDNINNSNHQLYIVKDLKENDSDNNNDNIIYDNNYYYNIPNNNIVIEDDNNIDNHKYHNIVHKNKDKEKDNGNIKEDIKEENIEIKKNENEQVNSPQINRREVARYFHIVNPRKYSYEKEMQYTDNNGNHRYKEIRHIDGQEDKIILKGRPRTKNYNHNNINNNNTEFISNIYYRYRTNENSKKYLDSDIINSTEQLKSPQIVKETFNTRLVNSKSFKKSPSEIVLLNPKNQIKYRYNITNSQNNNFNYNEEPNLNSNSKNFTINSYNENDNNDRLQIPNKNNNSKLKYKQFYDEKYDLNSHIKPISNYNYYKTNTIRNNNNNYNYNSINNNNINNNKIPKTFSLNNLYRNKLSNPRIVQNEYNYSSNNNNIQKLIQPNIDYATLKQTVKLAVLKKQMKEKEKKKKLNNQNDYNNMKYLKNKKSLKNILLNDNLTILEKTKKLLEKDKYKNDNIYNHKNDYNQNILKSKAKIWKP